MLHLLGVHLLFSAESDASLLRIVVALDVRPQPLLGARSAARAFGGVRRAPLECRAARIEDRACEERAVGDQCHCVCEPASMRGSTSWMCAPSRVLARSFLSAWRRCASHVCIAIASSRDLAVPHLLGSVAWQVGSKRLAWWEQLGRAARARCTLRLFY